MIDEEGLKARILELEEAERGGLAQFNYVAGRLREARELYAMAGEQSPASDEQEK